MKNDLRTLLDEIREKSESGNRRALTDSLKRVRDNRQEYYRQSAEGGMLDEYADALYKILLLELDESEEDSIEIAELAYVATTTTLNEAASPELYKRRLLLVHYFCDYFADSVIEVFLKKYKVDNLLQARSLAIGCLEKMQLSDMLHLEENESDFINQDEQLADACNGIETDPDLSDEERQEALLLHNVMHAYLRAKYKKNREL